MKMCVVFGWGMPTSRRHGSKDVRKRTKNDLITGLLGKDDYDACRRILAVYYRFLTFCRRDCRAYGVRWRSVPPFVVDTHTHTRTRQLCYVSILHTRARRVIGNPTGAEKRRTTPVIRERTTSDLKCRFRENLSAKIFIDIKYFMCLRPADSVAHARELNATRIRPDMHARTRGTIDGRTHTADTSGGTTDGRRRRCSSRLSWRKESERERAYSSRAPRLSLAPLLSLPLFRSLVPSRSLSLSLSL